MPNAQHDFRSVLIVDEDAGIRKLLRSQLDNIGFKAIGQTRVAYSKLKLVCGL